MAETFSDNMFLIELRLGRTKWRIKKTTAGIGRIFNIRQFIEKHPHITLFGPFIKKKEISIPNLLDVIETTAKPFGTIPFLIDGYDMNQGLNGAVIAYKISPSDQLVELTKAIGAATGRLAETFNQWDSDLDQKWYHVTVANRLERKRAEQIFLDLENWKPPSSDFPDRESGVPDNRGFLEEPDGKVTGNKPPRSPLLDEDGLRITVVNGEHILAEYDLLQHCWFSPDGESAAQAWQHTLAQYRLSSGIELTGPEYGTERDTYVISDLHLGHANIIRYCSRPFPHNAVDEMNQVLIRNWNYTVQPGERIYHIGDLCYGPLAKPPGEYLRQLNGNITLIEGSHDKGVETAKHSEMLVHQNIPFLLVHDPVDAPDSFTGWIIHGHHHNNDLGHYPFINFEMQRINVSAEVIRYQPVSLTELCTIIRDHQMKPEVKSIFLREL